MLRRPHLLAFAACLLGPLPLAGCASAGAPAESAFAQSLRSLDASIDALEKEPHRDRGDTPPVVAGAVVDLRDLLHEIERGSRGLEDHVGPDLRRGVEALAGSADQLRRAAGTGRQERLRGITRQIAAGIARTSDDLRALRRTVRPYLRPIAGDPSALSGRVATDHAVRIVRIVGGLYTLAAFGGLLSAIRGAGPGAPHHPGRSANRVLFAAAVAIGLAIATGGARPIATLASPEISMRTGDRACRDGIAKGQALAEALRAGAEIERGAAGAANVRHAKGFHAAPAGPPGRAELVELVRGGSRRRLLDRVQLAGSAESATLVTKPYAARPGVSEALAKDAGDLSAQCVALSDSRGEADEARYYQALARSYLDEPTGCSDPSLCEPADRRARRTAE